MSSRAALFKQAKETSQDNEKLLDLYWNRAELKKAYAELEDEQYRLNKSLKEHKETIARQQQQINNVEKLLADPEWVHSVAVHFQLRALHQRCVNRVANFAEQLKQQREKRMHAKVISEWNAKRADFAKDVQSQVESLHHKMDKCNGKIDKERARLREMNFFVRLFKRRKIQGVLNEHTATLEALESKEQELLRHLEELKHDVPPEQPGLDTAAKRSVNFMILSFVQQLFAHFEDDGFAIMTYEASRKSVGSDQYGDKSDCARILEWIENKWDAFDEVTKHADELQQRARLLAEKAVFSQDEDVIPAAASVAMLIVFNPGGTTAERHANLLGENYFDISAALSR